MKQIIFACNWKMYVDTPVRAKTLVHASIAAAQRANIPVIFLPSAVHFSGVVAAGGKHTGVSYGAQTISLYDRGAYTGEISARQMRALGATHVLVGHSERRRLFGETDAVVKQKIRRAWEAGIIPILCVGESKKTTPVRAAARACAQLKRAGEIGTKDQSWYVAYEPVWAIGGNKDVDPVYAAKVMQALHVCATKQNIRLRGVWYGGSVNQKTVAGFLKIKECTGVLIGSASADPRTMTALCKEAALLNGRIGA